MAGTLTGSMYGVAYNQSTLDAGMQVGDTMTVYDFEQGGFRELMLVQADENISANSALMFTAAGVVEEVDAAGDICNGVNDVSGFSVQPSVGLGTGAAILDTYYFWMTFRGVCNPNLDAATAEGPLATGSATPGYLSAWTDGGATFRQTNLQSLEASGAGGPTLCYIS